MNRFSHAILLCSLLTGACCAGSVSAASPMTPSDRLADLMMRLTRVLLQRDFVDVEAVDTALATMEQAIVLRPDDPEIHRLMVSVSALREDHERKLQALGEILRLDPSDEVARLGYLAARIDALSTAEERASEYRRLLQDPEAIGPAVASRLALEAALMERRRGDESAFARWLAESATLDPSNAAAAAIAAGFFRMHLTDPVEEAELLLQLFMADPTQPATATMLGRLLADHGAMTGAARMFNFVLSTYRANQTTAPTDLVADLAIAGWATQAPRDVLLMVRDTRRRMNLLVRHSAPQRLGYQPTPEERSMMVASLGGALETVEAAMLRQSGDADADLAVHRALQILRSERVQRAGLELPEGREDMADPLEGLTLSRTAQIALSSAILEEAWVAVWLGRDTTVVAGLLEEAAAEEELSPQAITRFRGWTALREGRISEALEMLEPAAESDVLAMLGTAHALETLGRTRDAARAHLSVARSSPGSLVGVWSQSELNRLLGVRAPISETAARLESLMRTLPTVYDQLPETPTQLIELRIVSDRMVFEIGEPLDFVLEIRNAGPVPLAIDRSGPIRPQVVIELETAFGRSGLRREGAPTVVVDISRHLRIPARGIIRVPLRLTQHPAGISIDQSMALGGFLRLTATVNPKAVSIAGDVPGQEPSFRPAALGARFVTQTIRLKGLELSMGYTRTLIEEASEPSVSEDRRAVLTATLLQVMTVAAQDDSNPAVRAEAQRQLAVILEMYEQLSLQAQAWVLGVVSMSSVSPRMHEFARATDNQLMRVIYILTHVSDINDPFVRTALEGNDPAMRRLGELFVANYHRVSQRIRERDQREGLLPSRP